MRLPHRCRRRHRATGPRFQEDLRWVGSSRIYKEVWWWETAREKTVGKNNTSKDEEDLLHHTQKLTTVGTKVKTTKGDRARHGTGPRRSKVDQYTCKNEDCKAKGILLVRYYSEPVGISESLTDNIRVEEADHLSFHLSLSLKSSSHLRLVRHVGLENKIIVL